MKVKTNIKSGEVWANPLPTSDKEQNGGAAQPDSNSWFSFKSITDLFS